MYYNENSIIAGLIYHFENYSKLHSSMYPIEKDTYTELMRKHNWMAINAMRHELTAYLNRMGQFYYFASSKVKSIKISVENEMPNIVKFIPLRHKVTAHRAEDKMLKNDIIEYVRQADNQIHGGAYVLMNGKFIFQLKLEYNIVLHFDLLDEHPKILSETYNLLKRLEQ